MRKPKFMEIFRQRFLQRPQKRARKVTQASQQTRSPLMLRPDQLSPPPPPKRQAPDDNRERSLRTLMERATQSAAELLGEEDHNFYADPPVNGMIVVRDRAGNKIAEVSMPNDQVTLVHASDDHCRMSDGTIGYPEKVKQTRSSRGVRVYTTTKWTTGAYSCNCPGWANNRTCRHVKESERCNATDMQAAGQTTATSLQSTPTQAVTPPSRGRGSRSVQVKEG